jgi:SulP family sulfate permease
MKLPALNFKQWPSLVGSYLKVDMKADALAGLTVAVMGVPQAMAYAVIAELPPVYGLYTAMITCVIAAVFGSSNHLVTGPTNALCMVILSLTAHLPAKYGYGAIEIVLLLTFLVGAIQLTFGLLRMGGVIRYVSHSVVIGFTAGAGILIAFNQVKNLIGVTFEERPVRFYDVVIQTISHLPQTKPFPLIVGALTIALVILIPKINERLPGAFIAVVLTGAISYLMGWHLPGMGGGKVEIVKDIEPIKASFSGIFHFPELLKPPPFELTRELGLGAASLAVLGLIEAASIARAVAGQSGQRLDFNREFIGQGAGNIAGSFFSCFAGSGSFTRTAVCFKSGGRTRMAAIFSAIWTALTILILADVANYIPKASLAGILVVIAYTMIDKRRLAVTWKSSRHSRLVLFGTLGSTMVLPLEYAIFVGVTLSLVLLLRVTGETDLTQLVPRTDSGFDEVPFERAAPSAVVTVNMEGDLYFAAAEDLDYKMLGCITSKTRVVILRMKRLRAVGSTAMAILDHFWEILSKRDIHLVVCGIEDDLKRVMTKSGLRNQIGEQNIFYADNKLFQSTELALARAWSIFEMEKVRLASEGAESSEHPGDLVTAESILDPKLLRFGNQHALREAVWLMSEMMKRSEAKTATPLFLQNKDGKLDGGLSIWTMLSVLGKDLPEDEELSEKDLRDHLRKSFDQSISEVCRKDLPRLHLETPLHVLTQTAVDADLAVLPICDEDGRLTGLVRSVDLLKGIGKSIGFNPEEELPKA